MASDAEADAPLAQAGPGGVPPTDGERNGPPAFPAQGPYPRVEYYPAAPYPIAPYSEARYPIAAPYPISPYFVAPYPTQPAMEPKPAAWSIGTTVLAIVAAVTISILGTVAVAFADHGPSTAGGVGGRVPNGQFGTGQFGTGHFGGASRRTGGAFPRAPRGVGAGGAATPAS